MEQEHANSLVKPVRVPWNKGKLVGAKTAAQAESRLVDQNKLQIEGKNAILLSPIWPSTANFETATSRYASMTSLPAVSRWTGNHSPEGDGAAGTVRAG